MIVSQHVRNTVCVCVCVCVCMHVCLCLFPCFVLNRMWYCIQQWLLILDKLLWVTNMSLTLWTLVLKCLMYSAGNLQYRCFWMQHPSTSMSRKGMMHPSKFLAQQQYWNFYGALELRESYWTSRSKLYLVTACDIYKHLTWVWVCFINAAHFEVLWSLYLSHHCESCQLSVFVIVKNDK
jgi:hypothetical protein